MGASSIPAPEHLEKLGVRRSLLEDLALKILCLEGELSLRDLAEKMRLRFSVVEEIFQNLRKEHLCEVKGMTGHVYRVVATSHGRTRGLESLSMSQYAGPAPVSLGDYVNRVRAQSVRQVLVQPDHVRKAFEDLVLDDDMLKQLGTAVISGTSIFLYGPTGTGKTSIALRLPRIYQDQVWIPYAVEVDGQIITVYDAAAHEPMDQNVPPESDGRWVLCRRPQVTAGGELTIEMLGLQLNPATKFYAAPLQMKANNGVMIVDDFGRQRIRPEEMLNRWIMPLDRGIDFLTLAGGKKFEIPFDLLVVFATNLDPTKLADEAFLRRIQNKVKVNYVTREQFHEIFRRVCEQLQLTYDAAVVDLFMGELTDELKQPLRACYPRDILHHICWAALYEGKLPRVDQGTVAQACRNYFLIA
jgi:predicted ATPase with chaperone activity